MRFGGPGQFDHAPGSARSAKGGKNRPNLGATGTRPWVTRPALALTCRPTLAARRYPTAIGGQDAPRVTDVWARASRSQSR